MKIATSDRITYYRMRYPHGTILELTADLEDPYTPKPSGSRFRVDFLDDIGQIHGSWLPPESGSIALDAERDKFKIVVE